MHMNHGSHIDPAMHYASKSINQDTKQYFTCPILVSLHLCSQYCIWTNQNLQVRLLISSKKNIA